MVFAKNQWTFLLFTTVYFSYDGNNNDNSAVDGLVTFTIMSTTIVLMMATGPLEDGSLS